MNKTKNIYQNTQCPICQTLGSYSHQYKSANTLFDKQPIFSCLNCYFSWNSTLSQEKLNEYYKEDYNLNDFNRSERFELPIKYFSNKNKMFKSERSIQHLKIVSRLVTKKNISILDCGAGLGTTLFLAKDYFNNASLYGYENDKFSHQYLDHIGAKYISGDPIESLKSLEETFDVIILSHFLEHISSGSLLSYVQLLLTKLKTGGILLIEVPHDNLVKYPQLLKNEPPHVGFFSIKSLKILFNEMGYIHLCGAVGSSIHKERSFLRKVIGRIYFLICSLLFKAPYTIDGGSIILCVSPKR